MRRHLLPALLLATLPGLAAAIQVCDLDGQPVNPNNGNATAGKSGLMRCREGEGGPVQREQQLQNGVFMGVVRFFKDGVLHREFHVNERGNRDGLSREYEGKQLVLEETSRNGNTVGLSRRWHANGQLRRATFYGDDGREQAVAEFTTQGKLYELRCAALPQLAPAVDDATLCGHRKPPSTVQLFAENGSLKGNLVLERGERRRTEWLGADGKPREIIETTPNGGTERSFNDEGKPRRERQWITAEDSGRKYRSYVLDREYHENGTLVGEKRFSPPPKGELLEERRWYLNGQLKETNVYTQADGKTLRRGTDYFDNGKPSSEGSWIQAGRYDRQPTGVHKHFDEQGRLRAEIHHDTKGRVNREREFDENGKLTRDDELFEDGSRKANAK